MNYDKIALKRVLNTKKLDLLSKIKPEYIKYGVARFMLKALKTYVRKYGVIPDLEVFIAELKKALPEDKQEIYIGYLEGLENVKGEITDDALIDALKSQYTLMITDENIEALVEASSAKDVDTVRQIISQLSATLNTHEKLPDNIVDVDYQPSKIRTIRPFIKSMEQRGVYLGGLSIIGAPTGGGKSVFLANQLLYSYKVEKLSVCLLNLELGSDESIARLYCAANNIEFSSIYGNTDPEVISKVNKWREEYFSEEQLFTLKNVRYDTDEIEEVIRQQAAMGITVFFIDYLSLVDAPNNKKEWETLRDLVRNLHSLTLELGIVIISPVQINIDEIAEGDGDVKVRVRGSRELENSSTLFLIIYQNIEERKNNVARLFTVKARNAGKFTYVLQTDFSKMRFTDTGIIL